VGEDFYKALSVVDDLFQEEVIFSKLSKVKGDSIYVANFLKK